MTLPQGRPNPFTDYYYFGLHNDFLGFIRFHQYRLPNTHNSIPCLFLRRHPARLDPGRIWVGLTPHFIMYQFSIFLPRTRCDNEKRFRLLGALVTSADVHTFLNGLG